MGRPRIAALALLVALGAATPLLLQQGCGESQLHPQTAAEAFQAVCLAAMAVEGESRGEDLTERALRYCADPALPARIATLLEVVHQLGEPVQVLELSDAGP